MYPLNDKLALVLPLKSLMAGLITLKIPFSPQIPLRAGMAPSASHELKEE